MCSMGTVLSTWNLRGMHGLNVPEHGLNNLNAIIHLLFGHNQWRSLRKRQ
jgi:hypothetical protein